MAAEYIVQALTTMQPCPAPAHWTAERQRALKPVLLLVTFDAIEQGIVSDNFVPFEAVMRDRFNDWWSLTTHMQAHDANFQLAFFHLADEPFWTLLDGERAPVVVEQHNQLLGDFLASRVAGAKLHPSLFALAQDQQCRRTLMTDIVVSQFPVHSSAFGRLWNRLHDLHAPEEWHETVSNQDEESTLADVVETADSDVTTRSNSSHDMFVLERKDVASDTTTSQHLDVTEVATTPHEGMHERETRSNVEHAQGRVGHLSLLPPRCVGALEVVTHDWRPFPLTSAAPDRQILKTATAIGLRTLGDLWKPSLLSILALVTPLDAASLKSRGFWAATYEVARASLTEVAETTLFELLRRAVPEPSFGQEHALSHSSHPATHQRTEDNLTAGGDGPSALFFSDDDIINSLPSFGLVSHQAIIAYTPVGQRMVPTRGVILGRLPLLSLPVRAALQAIGCPLASSSLTSLLLTTRTENALQRLGAIDVMDLVYHTPEDLLGLRQFGHKAFREVLMQLRAYLEPWLSQLSLDLLAPVAPPSENVADDANNDTQPGVHALNRHAQSSNDDAAYTVPFAALARWFDESPLPALLASAGMDWRQLRLGDVLEPMTEWGAESHLLDESLCGFLQLSMVAASFVPWDMTAVRKMAFDMREGLLRLVAARLLPASSDALDSDWPRESSCDITLSELFDKLTGPALADLRPRELQALYGRLGLRDGSPATLEDAGRRLNVTRERARQIEKKALDRLATDSIKRFTLALGDLARAAVLAEGGATTIRAAADRIASWLTFGELHPEATTRLLAAWSPETGSVGKDVLVAIPYTSAMFDRAQSAIRQVLQARHGISHDDLVAEALAVGGESVVAAGRDFVAAVLRTMPDVALRGEIYQPARRGALQARIVQAMRSLGHPAHFTEIAAEYRKLFPDDAERKDNSIHAFFDRFPETFVLVGSGTFALAEWGYDPRINSVPTLVEHILEQSERPMHVDEIVERAAARYRWASNSVSAQLSTNRRIRPFGNGFFGLKDRLYGPFDSSTAYEAVFGESKEVRERLVEYTGAPCRTGQTHRCHAERGNSRRQPAAARDST